MKNQLIARLETVRVSPHGGVLKMRSNLFQIAGLFLSLPLFGCASSIVVPLEPTDKLPVAGIHDDPAIPAVDATELLSAGECGRLSSSSPAMPTIGSLPFVRSRPKSVPPFPLVL